MLNAPRPTFRTSTCVVSPDSARVSISPNRRWRSSPSAIQLSQLLTVYHAISTVKVEIAFGSIHRWRPSPSGIEPDPLLPQRAPYTKGGHFGLTTIPTQPPLCEHMPKCEPHSLGQWQWCARSSRLVSLLGQSASNQRPVKLKFRIAHPVDDVLPLVEQPVMPPSNELLVGCSREGNNKQIQWIGPDSKHQTQAESAGNTMDASPSTHCLCFFMQALNASLSRFSVNQASTLVHG